MKNPGIYTDDTKFKKSKNFFLLNWATYSTTLRVISSGGGLGLNGFEEVCEREEV